MCLFMHSNFEYDICRFSFAPHFTPKNARRKCNGAFRVGRVRVDPGHAWRFRLSALLRLGAVLRRRQNATRSLRALLPCGRRPERQGLATPKQRRCRGTGSLGIQRPLPGGACNNGRDRPTARIPSTRGKNNQNPQHEGRVRNQSKINQNPQQ